MPLITTRASGGAFGLGWSAAGDTVFVVPPTYNTTNLVQFFDPAIEESYPGTGTTVTDLSGNNNNGTLVNGVSWTTIGGIPVFSFDGTNDYISTNLAVSNPGPVTYDMWVYLTSGYLGYLFGTAGSLTYYAQYARVVDSTDQIYSGAWGGSGNPLLYTYTVDNPGWINLTFTYHSSASPKRTIYLNGSLVASTSGYEGTRSHSYGVPWGNIRYDNGSYGTYYFNKSFGMMSRYHRVLSSGEISSNYSAYRTRFGV
jgi:hypothetical protein